MRYILYNPLSGKGNSECAAKELFSKNSENTVLINMTELLDYEEFVDKLTKEDSIIILGGDGTLNRFINSIADVKISCNIDYLPCGSGNDFAKDVHLEKPDEPFGINDYLENLPTVTVNGKQMRFINGVGYGIDGYCCAVGDKLREKKKKINYTMIAIKGLLFHYKPAGATIIVDGVEHRYKKVWIAPTMVGRHYGGGMIPTPDQKRGDGLLSVMAFHDTSSLKTLAIFPSIFKGEHIAHTEAVDVFRGKSITVRYDKPTFLQVDGETICDVSEYTAKI